MEQDEIVVSPRTDKETEVQDELQVLRQKNRERQAQEDKRIAKEEEGKKKKFNKKWKAQKAKIVKRFGLNDFSDFPKRNYLRSAPNPVIVQSGSIETTTRDYTAEDFKKSRALAETLAQVEAGDTQGLSEETVGAISEINIAIDQAIEETGKKLLFQASEVERESYTSDDVAARFQLKSFKAQVRYLVCRMIFEINQEESPDKDIYERITQNKDNIKEIIDDIPQLIEDVYSTDIPLYDRVLQDFDRMRKENPDMLEVYLARDGLFAYYGRRAQAAVRSMLMNPEDRRRMRETGELHEYVPKYQSLLFNRRMSGQFYDENLFPEDFSTEQRARMEATQRQYLEQEGIVDQDIHFFDTGFSGTIPEQIMKILGFPKSEIDKRIHLLTADDRDRRSRGLRINHRRKSLEIEHKRPKLTESAQGFSINPDDPSRVDVVVAPATQTDIFFSLIIREVIHRHFWYQEQLRSGGR